MNIQATTRSVFVTQYFLELFELLNKRILNLRHLQRHDVLIHFVGAVYFGSVSAGVDRAEETRGSFCGSSDM